MFVDMVNAEYASLAARNIYFYNGVDVNALDSEALENAMYLRRVRLYLFAEIGLFFKANLKLQLLIVPRSSITIWVADWNIAGEVVELLKKMVSMPSSITKSDPDLVQPKLWQAENKWFAFQG